MRVIAGALGGRQFQSPSGYRSHPMGDKVRGALFAALGDINGLSLLDAYSGSGALAIEAVSRGATPVIAVDNDSRAVNCIQGNIRILGIQESIIVSQAPIYSWSMQRSEQKFDIVLADPPYDDLHTSHIVQLVSNVLTGGLLVLSWPSGQSLPYLTSTEIVRDKSYAQARLVFYRKLSE